MRPGLRKRSRSVFAGVVHLSASLAILAGQADAQRADSLAHDSSARTMSARLRGVVTSQNGKRPVSGADVWIVSVNRGARTDSAGEFRVDGLPAGPQLIEIRRIGFDERRETITLESGKETTHRFSLTPAAQPLDTVRSLAKDSTYISPMLRGFEERRLSRQGGQFISDSVLRASDNQMLAQVLTSQVPGATITAGPKGSRVLVSTRKSCRGPVLLHSCTRPDCYVEVYIDGVLMYYPGANEDPPNMDRMGVTDLAGVEFYAGGASMPVGMHSSTDQGCGSLWLWTREK